MHAICKLCASFSFKVGFHIIPEKSFVMPVI
jgi:hypothetical protein